MRWRWLVAALGLSLAGCGDDEDQVRAADTVRVATYNLHLARGEAGKLVTELRDGSAQVDAVVRVIAAVDPDILVLNELDFDTEREALALFQQRLAEAGIAYAYSFVAPVNTGKRTNLDLSGDGKDTAPEDMQGWGVFEGQFGMAVLSRLPILGDDVRTFQNVRWTEMPDNLYPLDFFPDEARDVLRLSSKSHWDVPVQAGSGVVNLLVSHPTPPIGDGPEERNARRNHDEVRFWTDYIEDADWILSDQGSEGGLAEGSDFVILGDLNADPDKGNGRREAIRALLAHPKVNDVTPKGGEGPATARFDAGNLRVDYVLPSKGLEVRDSGVYWPAKDDPMRETARFASDHRLVWVDLGLPGVTKTVD